MKISDFYRPTPVLFRKLGDTILIGCTSLSAVMMGAPIDERTRSWVIIGLNILGVAGKMITNFFKEDGSADEQK